MPVYNGSKHLNESIGSILKQDFENFILLCYNDGSTDDSVEVLKSFRDDKIRIIEGGENRGGIYARTQLINAVETKYCMWLDDDDRYCRSDAVSEVMRTIKSNDFDMVNFVRIDEVDSNGNHAITKPMLYGDFEYCGDRLFEKLYPTDNHFIFNSKIFKAELLKKAFPTMASCRGDSALTTCFSLRCGSSMQEDIVTRQRASPFLNTRRTSEYGGVPGLTCLRSALGTCAFFNIVFFCRYITG